MRRWSNGLGRTIVITVIAGALFAGFLVLAPRHGSTDLATAAATPVVSTTTASPPAIEAAEGPEPIVEAPGAPVDDPTIAATPGVRRNPVPTSTPTASESGTTATVALTVEVTDSDDDPVESGDGDIQFTLSNDSDDESGSSVNLELKGPTWCEDDHLAPGGSTSCWISTTAEDVDG
jgi:hypothetical protein